MKIEIFSDIVCPWCYIGERRFSHALRSYQHVDDVEVSFRPYQLDPDIPEGGIPLPKYLRRRHGTSAPAMMRAAADAAHAEGINMHFESAIAANTFTAHRLLRLALEEFGAPVQRELTNIMFAGHFVRGLDIADRETLIQMSLQVEMRRERVAAYLDSEEGEQELREELDHARHLGITAVPTFVFDGRFAVQGAQPPATFVQVMNEVAAASA